jgi:hypothetical protein
VLEPPAPDLAAASPSGEQQRLSMQKNKMVHGDSQKIKMIKVKNWKIHPFFGGTYPSEKTNLE